MRLWSPLARWQKLAVVFTLLLGSYAVLGYVGVPRILRAQVPALLEDSIDRKAEIGEVSFDPFLLRLDVHDLRVFDRAGGDFAGFERFTVDFDPLLSLFELEYHFKEATLVDPLVDIELLADGSLDFADIGGPDEAAVEAEEEEPSQETAAETDDAPLPTVEFERLSIEGGRFVYTDHSRTPAFQRRVGPVTFEVENFGTRPGEESGYAFEARTEEGARVAWSGRVTVDPLSSAGDISIEDIPLPWFWEFIEDRAHFVVRQGIVDVSATYTLSTSDGVTDYAIADGGVAVTGLVVTPRGEEKPFITLPELTIDGVFVDVNQQQVTVRKLASRGARLAGHLEADGAFSWIDWLALDPGPAALPAEAATPAEPEPSPEPSAATEAAPPLTVTLAALQLEDWGFAFEDRGTSPVAAVSLEPIALDVRDVSLDMTQPLPVELDVGVGESGAVHVGGTVTPEPLRLELELAVEAVDLTTFAPYLANLGRFDLRRGTAGAKGQLRLEPAGAAPVVRYAGELSLDGLAAADRATRRDFVRFDSLALRGIDVTSEPLEVTLGEVGLQRPFVRVSLAKDGALNLSEVFGGDAEAPEQAAEAAATEQEAAAAGRPIRVDRVRVVDGAFEFVDESVEPRYATSLDEFTGTIEGLSSDPRARAKVELAGELDKYAPMKIAGEINPLAAEGYTDLEVSLRNLELSSFTPYSGKYAGYEIDKGKLNLAVAYKLDARNVEGKNELFLDQLDFGDKVKSESATSLPVPLAVAILKDKRGEIHIDLPVRGNLDDPEFSYGRMLGRTLLNLVTKAATSPFGMLGNLVGLNPDEMSYVAFAPGGAALAPAEQEKLAAIAKALGERPALRLEVLGAATAEDLPGLRVAGVEHDLKLLRWDRMSASRRSTMAGPDDVVLAPDDRGELLEKLYENRFDESYRGLRSRLREERDPSAPEPEDEKALVYEAMQRALVDAQPAGEAELRGLAKARARGVKDALVGNDVPAERIFVAVDVDSGGDVAGAGRAYGAVGAGLGEDPGAAPSIHCPLTLAGS